MRFTPLRSNQMFLLWLMLFAIVTKSSDAQTNQAQPSKNNKPETTQTPPSKVVSASSGVELLYVKSGTFYMGTSPDKFVNNLSANEAPRHQVTITKPFYLGKYEVTQKQWKSVMGTEPWKGKPNSQIGDRIPATFVSWDDAVEFCNRLSSKDNAKYRLPTEAEWEYACRSGTQTSYSFGDSGNLIGDYDWIRRNSGRARHPHPVGDKKPNPWGFHNMHGNVSEWCQDFYSKDYYAASPKADPVNLKETPRRIRRGGCFSHSIFHSAARGAAHPNDRAAADGFRIVREFDQVEADKITISYAKFGEGRHHGRVEKFVEEAANKEGVISLLTSSGLKSKNPSGKPRPILRITYQVNGKTGTIDFRYGQKVDFRKEILKHASTKGRPFQQIKISYAMFGNGPNKVRCEEQVAAVASQMDIVTPITTHGLSLRNPSGRVRKQLVFRYEVGGVKGDLTLNYGQQVDLRKTILTAAQKKGLAAYPAIPKKTVPPTGNSTAKKVKAETTPPVENRFELPAKFDVVRSGADGTLLIFFIREKSMLLIYDVVKQKKVKEIPVNGEAVFAANKTDLVLFRTSSGVVERWSLKTFERKLIENYDRKFVPKHALMGNAGDGPLLVWGEQVHLWNAKTLKPIELFGNLLGWDKRSNFSQYAKSIAVSNDGKVFCHMGYQFQVVKIKPYGITFDRTDGYHSYNGSWAMPNADGSQLLRYRGGFYGHDLAVIPSEQFKKGVVLPSQDPNYFLFVEGDKTKSSVSICSAVDLKVIHKSIPIPDVMSHSLDTFRAHFRFEPAVRYLPEHGVLICLPTNQKEVVVRKVDLKKELGEVKGHLFVVSKPAPFVKHDEDFQHQLKTLSSSPVTFSMVSGPEGATVATDGLITWKPTDLKQGETVNFRIKAANEEGTTAEFGFVLEIDRGEIPQKVILDTARNKKGLMAKYAVPEHELPFKSKLTRIRYGKAGQLLIVHLPDDDKLAIVDIKERKIVKEIPVADSAVYAASLKYLLVADPDRKALLRYDLSTFEQDKRVDLDGQPRTIAQMGPSGNGPLALWNSGDLELWDIERMEKRPKRGDVISLGDRAPYGLSVSADGTTFCSFYRGPFSVMRVSKQSTSVTRTKDSHSHNQAWIMPAPRGEMFFRYHNAGYDIRLNPVEFPTDLKDYGVYPTFDSRFCIAVTAKPVQNRYVQQFSEALLCSTSDMSPLKKIDFLQSVTNGISTMRGRLEAEPRIQFFPEFKSLVYLPDSNDKIVFRDLTLESSVKASSKPYVNIISIPEPAVMVGEMFKYQPEALSHKKNVKYKLVKAPQDMKLDADGNITWEVKKRPIGGIVSVEVEAELDGQKDSQRFELRIERNLAKGKDPQGLGFAKVDKLRLELPQPVHSRTVGLGRKQLLLVGNSLAILDADGWSVIKVVKLEKEYRKIYEREKYFVAVSEKSKSIDLLDKNNLSVIRSKSVPLVNVTDMVIHPSLPISYIAYKKDVDIPRYRFIVIDESTMVAKDNNEWIGNWFAIDPHGQYLITGYSDSYRKGSRLLINPTRWDVVPEYGSLGWLVRYQLNRSGYPTFDEAKQKVGANGNGVRLSGDGKRVTYLSFTGYPKYTKNLGGFDPSDFSVLPTSYPTKDNASCRFFDFHPTLPIAVSAAKDSVVFFDQESGEVIQRKLDIDPAELDGLKDPNPYFSPDGKYLIVDGGINGIRYLHKIPLNLSESEAAKNANGLERLAKGPTPIEYAKIDIAKLDTFAGAQRKKLSKAEIARSYKNSVVVVQSRKSNGTGFVIGSSGYILTCEHCLPDKRQIKVTYQTASGESKTVDAKLVTEDATADLAIIKIDVPESVVPAIIEAGNDIEIGESVTVIANPSVGATILNHTMTAGIVSNANRKIEGLNLIQTNAEVNPGSSGGPMFDEQGRVIGMVVLKAKIEGAGFAIPSNAICQFLIKNMNYSEQSIQLVRNWYDSTGRGPLRAKLVEINDKSITIERTSDSETFELPFEKLSQLDLEFVKLLQTKDKKNSADPFDGK